MQSDEALEKAAAAAIANAVAIERSAQFCREAADS